MTDRPEVVDQLRALMDLSAVVNSSMSGAEIQQRSIEAATALLNAERGSLLLRDERTGELCFEIALGEGAEKLKEVRLACGEGIAGWVAENAEGIIVHDVANDERFYTNADGVSGFKTRNMVCVPVLSKGTVIGVLQAINCKQGSFEDSDVELLSALANQVAVAIENAALYEDLKQTFFETAAALAETIDKRDPYTGGHTRRVMEYSKDIAMVMGLPQAEVDEIELAAILHDVGKVAISDEILRKPGGLTEEEYLAMRSHATVSGEIVGRVRRLVPLIPGVRGHHERPDGRGYPDGLVAEEIPLCARIIAVADSFDAMTSDRPYRLGMPFIDAATELRANSGTQFDANVVEVFLTLLEERHGTALSDGQWRPSGHSALPTRPEEQL